MSLLRSSTRLSSPSCPRHPTFVRPHQDEPPTPCPSRCDMRGRNGSPPCRQHDGTGHGRPARPPLGGVGLGADEGAFVSGAQHLAHAGGKPAMTEAIGPIRVNRAATLTLWAAVVAERLGYSPETAMTLAGSRRVQCTGQAPALGDHGRSPGSGGAAYRGGRAEAQSRDGPGCLGATCRCWRRSLPPGATRWATRSPLSPPGCRTPGRASPILPTERHGGHRDGGAGRRHRSGHELITGVFQQEQAHSRLGLSDFTDTTTLRYLQVWTARSRLGSSIYATMRRLSSSFDRTRIWRSIERAISEKRSSIRLSQEPCLGVNTNAKRPSRCAAAHAFVFVDMHAEWLSRISL